MISPVNLKEDEIYPLVKDNTRRQGTNETHQQILSWLSPDDFEETHEDYYRKRSRKTGQWLLDDPRFIDWRDQTQSSLLWCHGARKW